MLASIEPMIVIIDDIFEVIMSPHRKTALAFIELLLEGPLHIMYFIAGSSGIYKNLLNQLINVSPAVKKRFQKANHTGNINEPLAAQLIINADGMVFFKERGEAEFVRLYGR